MVHAERATLRLIGYWTGPLAAGWPDPRDFVDHSWDQREREDVADYLTQGFIYVSYGGISICRFCGRENGALELTDRTWYWPDGLPHYLVEHGVRLPQVFVDHVNVQLNSLDDFNRDDDWWRGTRGLDA